MNSRTKTIGIISAATATLVAVYSAVGFERSIETRIIIDASPAEVWNELARVDRYADWNPFIREISGELVEGHKIKALIQPPGQSASRFEPTLVKVKLGRELRWIGSVGSRAIFAGEHYWILRTTDHGQTELVHGENFSGFLAPVLWPLLKESTEAGFEAMNRALKERVERGS